MLLRKLHPRLQDFIKDQKWGDLTPIQKIAFDPIFNGTSCTIEAPTSGGKTEAVLFPLLTRIAASKSEGFKILYIAPLKALLNDLELRIVPYAKMCYKEAFKWHGDVSQADKVQQMVFPSDILMTTPESIEAILLRKADWRDLFKSLETIVIDEAHYFALTERGAHLVSLLERIEAEIKTQPQRIAVTATVGNPEELLEWLMSGRENGECIKVAGTDTKERDFSIHYFEENGPSLQDYLYQQLIGKKSIVFARSRSGTEETATQINEQNEASGARIPVKVRTHHSSISKRLREEAEGSIKRASESSLNAIISTSTLELGIDIGELDQVIQIGGLNSSGSFLQRVGRTGRRAGRAQLFRGLCEDEDELVLLTGCVSLGWQRSSEKILFPKKTFNILAHQVICLCLQQNGITRDYAWKTLANASCFSDITRSEFDALVEHMLKVEFLREIAGKILLTSNKTEDEFLRSNWRRLFAIFDTGPMYNVVDGKKIIGTLDSGFARAQTLPFVFVLGGQEWNALKLDHEMQQVKVEKNKTGEAPKWKAIGNYDIPFELAQEVGWLLTTGQQPEFLDKVAGKIWRSHQQRHENIGWTKNNWSIETTSLDTAIVIWTFAGEKINRALTMLLTVETKEKIDYDYKCLVITIKKENSLTLEELKQLLQDYKSKPIRELESTIENKIEVKWFSKFSDCLPEALAKKTIREKGMDITGLSRQLNQVMIY